MKNPWATQIFLDSGDPAETKEVLAMLGFLDGQTTNPSLVAKNPFIIELKNNHELTKEVIWDAYKKIIDEIHELIPIGALSAEVDASSSSTYESVIARARMIAGWFPGIYVKLPITHVGLQVAKTLVQEGVRVNMTLCFSQEQAAAVHDATKGATSDQVFISPFIGRLDDQGFSGIDIIKNIMRMYTIWGSHVQVLGASVRSLEHVVGCISAGCHAITISQAVAVSWVDFGIDQDINHYKNTEEILEKKSKESIEYKDIPEHDWEQYDINHELTEKGLQKFSDDWEQLFVK